MNVAFDASSISGYSGINTYTRTLIGALSREFPEDRFLLLSTSSASRVRHLRELYAGASNIEIRRAMLSPIALGPSLRRLTFLLRGIALGLAAAKADVLHLTQPYRERVRGSNLVITAHDLFPLVLDDYSREAVLGEFRRNARVMLHRARHVIVYTHAVRDQIESVFPGAVRRFSIIPAAADERFRPSREAPFSFLPEGERPRGACFFYVGSAYPRKNLPRILRAWGDLPEELRDRHPLVLVLTGAKLHREQFVEENASLLAARSVHRLGPVSDEELVRIYGSAAALVFPSLAEGFGLPVLEAMRCGCPVITSDASCLPEVAGDAALLVDPESRQAITDAMRRVVREEGLAERLRSRGLEHAGRFTWEKTARSTMEVYRSVAGT